MSRLIVPNWVARHRTLPGNRASCARLRPKLAKFRSDAPVVSIVIPAYNEEQTLLQTLSSLADQQTQVPTELIVANNNSSDRTQEILDACGVKSLFVRTQGVAHARQAGLEAAKGQLVASADADCLYPTGWVDAITRPLLRPSVSCTYGLYSFIPSEHSSRLALELYETLSHTANWLRNINKAYLNVYGFNFAFRRGDAIDVGGFALDTGREGSLAELAAEGKLPPPSGRCEDGWMALSLVQAGKGTICRVTDADAHVWTSDRRLIADGSLGKAFTNRLRGYLGVNAS
ncbi:MAG: glycosyltransferase [Bacteroidetes bacterium]|nr:glycosyltransferase [Fibrella sp.]